MYLVVFKFLRFLNSRKWKVKVKVAQCVWLCDPGQNTVVGSLPLPQGIFPTRGSNSGLPHCGFFTRWATREAQEYWSGLPIPSPGDLPDPGIEPGSPALQVDFSPAELPGKPILLVLYVLNTIKSYGTRTIYLCDQCDAFFPNFKYGDLIRPFLGVYFSQY